VLAVMLREGQPLRLPDVRAHPRFEGWWPQAHPELVDILAPLALDDPQAHPWRDGSASRIPGEVNRWNKGQAWTALRPERVAEVTYDQMEVDRFRHVAGFVRWRPDRLAVSCGFDQLQTPPPARIEDLIQA